MVHGDRLQYVLVFWCCFVFLPLLSCNGVGKEKKQCFEGARAIHKYKDYAFKHASSIVYVLHQKVRGSKGANANTVQSRTLPNSLPWKQSPLLSSPWGLTRTTHTTYAQALCKDGFNTPALLATVKEEDLKDFGITARGHVRAILGGAKSAPVAAITARDEVVQYDAFLTHNWGGGNHEKVSEINKALKREGIRTWFDEEKMAGHHILKDMTDGIDKSRKVVVFITKTYMEKVMGTDNTDNCQREFSYADSTKNGSMNMIPVVMEEDMRDQSKWKGLLGIVLGKALYYDLCPSVVGAAREKNIKALVKAVKGEIDVVGASVAVAVSMTISSLMYKSSLAVQILEGHTSFVQSVRFSPDGKRIVSGSFDHTVRVWDADNGKELRKLEGHTAGVKSVCFSPDGKRIVSGSGGFGSNDNTVRVWDADSEKEIRKLDGHTDPVMSVSFSPDGKRIVSGSSDKTICVWDADSGNVLRKLEGHAEPVISACFSFDGKRIVSGSYDNTGRVWDSNSGKEIRKLEGHANLVTSVCFSPDDKRIVSGSYDKTVRVWDSNSGKEMRKLEGHTDIVKSVCFSLDGKRIVSGSEDQTLRVWDTDNGKELRNLEGHSYAVTSVCFSPDGKRIVSGSDDKTVRIWSLLE